MIHSKFDIPHKTWWQAAYIEAMETDDLIFTILQKRKALETAIDSEIDEDFVQGYAEFHYDKYLKECISAESNMELTVAEKLVNINLDEPKDQEMWHLITKVKNLRETIVYLFPSFYVPDLKITLFTVSLAQRIHRKIGKEIIQNAGEFRTKDAKPACEIEYYLSPSLIETKLKLLFKQCRNIFKNKDMKLLDAVKYGACFLTNFLYIHPFSNGNGRVGRLLLSYLLAQFTVVPLSLYNGKRSRDIYLECLRESRCDDKIMKPNALARYILECIETQFSVVCFALEIDV